MDSFFGFSISLMNKLTYPKKFLLISAMFLLVLAFPMYQFTHTVLNDMAFSEKERVGIEYNLALEEVLLDLLKGNNSSLPSKIKALSALSEEQNGNLMLQEPWEKLEASLKNHNGSMKQRLTAADDAIALLTYVGDKSNLILDPDLDTYYLMDSVILRLAQAEKNIIDLREYMSTLTPGEPLSLNQTLQLASLKNSLSDKASTVKANLDVSYRETADADSLKKQLDTPLNEFLATMNKLVAVSDKVLSTQSIAPDQIRYTATLAEKGLEKTSTLFTQESDALDKLIHVRVGKKPAPLVFATIVTIVLLGLISYLLSGFYLSVKAALSTLGQTTQKLANGDLTARLELNTKDELGQLNYSFDNLAKSLARLIGSIHQEVNTVASASEGLSSTSQQLKSSAESMTKASNTAATLIEEVDTGMKTVVTAVEQSSANIQEIFKTSEKVSENSDVMGKSVLQVSDNMQNVAAASEEMSASVNTVAASIEEMNASLNEVARNAGKAFQVSQEAKQKAEKSIQTVDSLGIAAKQIENIIEVIKGIASQTNLLALNATIEAASAGEAGKGFAVVANEVKELAKESAGATEEIRLQIEEIQKNTQATVQDIKEIANIIIEMTQINNTITSAIEEQTATIEEISRSVSGAAQAATDVSRNVQESTIKIDDTVNKVQESLQGIKLITDNLNQLTQGTEEIAKNAADSSKNTSEMTKDIENVQCSSEKTFQDALKVSDTSEELSQLASKLGQLVGTFRF